MIEQSTSQIKCDRIIVHIIYTTLELNNCSASEWFRFVLSETDIFCKFRMVVHGNVSNNFIVYTWKKHDLQSVSLLPEESFVQGATLQLELR